MYQFQTYLNNISVIEGIFHGTKPQQQEKVEDDNLLIEQAKKLGLKVPTKIITGDN